jgi:hypothetical protein
MQPLKQLVPIDIAGWQVDEEFAVFPQGARAKEAVFCPVNQSDTCLVQSKRYLFKRSKACYPDQFWGEVVAYRVGCVLGFDVPPAFAAWNSTTNISGALIEWFYDDGGEVSVHAGDFLTRVHADFDRDRGTTHNMRDNVQLLRALSMGGAIQENSWRQWWVNALAFDALIGNTDRHQDNWTILFSTSTKGAVNSGRARLSPLFDNGTSLGHERFTDRIRDWSQSQFENYVNKGTHQVKWSLDEPNLKGHFDLLERALQEWPETKQHLSTRISETTVQDFENTIDDLLRLELPVRYCEDRHQFICKLLHIRLLKLKDLLR